MSKHLSYFIMDSPVINAFCNWPLNPVFHGPMVATPCFRQKMNMEAKMMSKTATLGTIMMIYLCASSESPLGGESVVVVWEDSLLGLDEFWEWGLAREGGGASGALDCLFFPFVTAGKDPLLRVIGTVVISEGRDPTSTGAAARLLDCSSNLRRDENPFCVFRTIFGSAMSIQIIREIAFFKQQKFKSNVTFS